MVRFERSLYRHPLAGLLCDSSQIVLSVQVDDIKIVGRKENGDLCGQFLEKQPIEIPQVRLSERVVEQIVDELFHHFMEEVEAARLTPQERSEQRIVEETVDVCLGTTDPGAEV